jgi:hypothetical protein
VTYRWVKTGIFLELLNGRDSAAGCVVRSFLRRKVWCAWVSYGGGVEHYPTRAAAMRAVASGVDEAVKAALDRLSGTKAEGSP